MKFIKNKKTEKENKDPLDYYFGKPRIEMSGSECLVDGLEKIIEYSNTKITVSLGSQEITFWGDGLKINSFTPSVFAFLQTSTARSVLTV